MEVKYRLFYDKRAFPVGVAYVGYDDFVDRSTDITCFTYGRMNSTKVIKKAIEHITPDDSAAFDLTDGYYFGPVQVVNMPPDGDMVPDDIVYEHQQIYNHRKTA